MLSYENDLCCRMMESDSNNETVLSPTDVRKTLEQSLEQTAADVLKETPSNDEEATASGARLKSPVRATTAGASSANLPFGGLTLNPPQSTFAIKTDQQPQKGTAATFQLSGMSPANSTTTATSSSNVPFKGLMFNPPQNTFAIKTDQEPAKGTTSTFQLGGTSPATSSTPVTSQTGGVFGFGTNSFAASTPFATPVFGGNTSTASTTQNNKPTPVFGFAASSTKPATSKLESTSSPFVFGTTGVSLFSSGSSQTPSPLFGGFGGFSSKPAQPASTVEPDQSKTPVFGQGLFASKPLQTVASDETNSTTPSIGLFSSQETRRVLKPKSAGSDKGFGLGPESSSTTTPLSFSGLANLTVSSSTTKMSTTSTKNASLNASGTGISSSVSSDTPSFFAFGRGATGSKSTALPESTSASMSGTISISRTNGATGGQPVQSIKPFNVSQTTIQRKVSLSS